MVGGAGGGGRANAPSESFCGGRGWGWAGWGEWGRVSEGSGCDATYGRGEAEDGGGEAGGIIRALGFAGVGFAGGNGGV